MSKCQDARRKVSRRGFLAGTMALLGAAAAGSVGCSPALKETQEGPVDVVEQQPVVQAQAADAVPPNMLKGGSWRAVECTGCGGGNCVNKGYVVDGVVVRMKTDDSHADGEGTPQIRSCMKGHLNNRYYHAANRLNYPLKRKHWQPGGGENSNGQLRGRDEWERISWDEAFELAAQELTRIKEQYGNQAILDRTAGGNPVSGAQGAGCQFPQPAVLTAFGGALNEWGEVSMGATTVVSTARTGVMSPFGDDYLTRAHTAKLIVGWAGDYAMSSPFTDFTMLEAKKNGAKYVYIGPWYNLSSQGLADMYIPVRPGTDGAFSLAVAYVMIRNDWQDQAFLDKYCVGFDAEHMPEVAPTGENFKDYVLGAYDDIPKTPEWASEICGTPVELIEEFAKLLHDTKPVSFLGAPAAGRTSNGHNYQEMMYVLAWMCGSSDFANFPYWGGATMQYAAFGGPSGATVPPVDPTVGTGTFGHYELSFNQYHDEYFYGPAYCDTYDAILTGKFHHLKKGETPINIKCITCLGATSYLGSISGTMKGIEAYRAVDFVLTSDLFFSTDCVYSDIVLPVAANWEKGFGKLTAAGPALLCSTSFMEPLYERKSDADIQVGLARALGIDETLIVQMPERQSDFNMFAGATALDPADPAAGMKTLLTITQDDLDEFGVEGAPQEGMIPIKKFLEDGIYQVPRSFGDSLSASPNAAFIADPEANPVPTATGKWEIYSWAFKEAYDVFAIDEVDPLPKYVPALGGYEDTFVDWENKVKGEYDLQFVSVHYISQAHHQLSDTAEANEIWPNALQMNPIDAKARGISDGDAVLVESERGKIAVHVTLTPRIMPGVVLHGHGNMVDLDEETGVDMGGSDNIITNDHLVGIGQNPWNSTIVKVSKWAGKPLEARYLRPRRPNYA